MFFSSLSYTVILAVLVQLCVCLPEPNYNGLYTEVDTTYKILKGFYPYHRRLSRQELANFVYLAGMEAKGRVRGQHNPLAPIEPHGLGGWQDERFNIHLATTKNAMGRDYHAEGNIRDQAMTAAHGGREIKGGMFIMFAWYAQSGPGFKPSCNKCKIILGNAGAEDGRRWDLRPEAPIVHAGWTVVFDEANFIFKFTSNYGPVTRWRVPPTTEPPAPALPPG